MTKKKSNDGAAGEAAHVRSEEVEAPGIRARCLGKACDFLRRLRGDFVFLRGVKK